MLVHPLAGPLIPRPDRVRIVAPTGVSSVWTQNRSGRLCPVASKRRTERLLESRQMQIPVVPAVAGIYVSRARGHNDVSNTCANPSACLAGRGSGARLPWILQMTDPPSSFLTSSARMLCPRSRTLGPSFGRDISGGACRKHDAKKDGAQTCMVACACVCFQMYVRVPLA